MSKLVFVLSSSKPESSLTPKPIVEQNVEPMVAPEDRMIGKVFLRKKATVPRPIKVQESKRATGNEVTVFDPPLTNRVKLQSRKNINQNLPIVIRKGTRECTKHPLYPLSYVVTFEKFSPFHKSFLTSLNNIHIPTTISDALSNENWKQVMNVEMEALEKNKTWKLLLVGKD